MFTRLRNLPYVPFTEIPPRIFPETNPCSTGASKPNPEILTCKVCTSLCTGQAKVKGTATIVSTMSSCVLFRHREVVS
jgi:hypothetical protein